MSDGVSDEHRCDIERAAQAAVYRHMYEASGGPYNFYQFKLGEPVIINLVGDDPANLGLGVDQTLAGDLVDNRRGIITVTDASDQPDLVGETIGLAATMRMMTPGGILSVPWMATVAPKADAAYYLPSEVDQTANYGVPEHYTSFFAKYARVQIGRVVLFGEYT